MCCKRKNQPRDTNQRGRTMRRASEASTPLVLTPSSSKSSTSSAESLADKINNMTLKPEGTPPPSYDSITPIRTYRTAIPSEIPPPLKLDPHYMSQLNESRTDLSDAEEFFEMTPRGTMQQNAEMAGATEVFVRKWKSRREERAAEREEWRERKRERKVERAARKAEKYRERAEKWAERAVVRERGVGY